MPELQSPAWELAHLGGQRQPEQGRFVVLPEN
jgi:hypothetical protein